VTTRPEQVHEFGQFGVDSALTLMGFVSCCARIKRSRSFFPDMTASNTLYYNGLSGWWPGLA
jgi:hypothetical protein